MISTATFSRAAKGLGLAAFLCAATSHAAIVTTLFPNDSTADFAQWEGFAGAATDPQSPDLPGGLNNTTVTMSTAGVPAFPSGGNPSTFGGTVLYSGGSIIPRYTFTNSVVASLTGISTLIIQIQMEAPVLGNLNGDGATLTYGGNIVAPAFKNFDFTNRTYSWQYDLSSVPDGTFNFVVDGTAEHSALGGARIDISTQSFTGVNLVPEPSGIVLALTGGLSVFFIRRRQ